MNQQQYRALTGWARQNPARQQVMTGLCRLLPYSLFFFYAAASLCLIAHFARTGALHRGVLSLRARKRLVCGF